MLNFGGMATCIVSYLDPEGIRHTAEVQAGTLFEAAALAVKTFKQHDCEPRGLNTLEVEMRTSVTHSLTVKKLHEWLTGSSKNPKDAVLKDRLRELLELNGR